jgi:hypothetical protein
MTRKARSSSHLAKKSDEAPPLDRLHDWIFK